METDPKDAQIILHMVRIGHVQCYCDPLAHRLVDIQELSKTHEAISRSKTELWHRLLTHYLSLYFPEAERFRGREPEGPTVQWTVGPANAQRLVLPSSRCSRTRR